MKTLIYTTLLFCSIIFYTSCNQSNKYAAEIKQIDSVSTLLDSFSKIFYSIDTAHINQRLKKINEHLSTIDKNIKDTVSFEAATSLSEYHSCKKPFRTIIQQYPSNKENIATTKKQLSDLKHDLQIEKVEEAKAKEYVSLEINAASKLINELDVNNQLTKMYFEKQDIFEPKIKVLIDSILKL